MYIHTDMEGPTTATPQVKYTKSMPLPTYEQSEKYETEGVLDLRRRDTDGEETDDETPQRAMVAGTWSEFMLFFLSECALSGHYLFLFSVCLFIR